MDLNPQSDEETIMVPDDIEKEFMKANQVQYIVLGANNQISRCQGCDGEITKREKEKPKNMVFLYKMRRKVSPAGGTGKWVLSKEKRNCYFHAADMGCLREIVVLADIDASQIYMSNQNMKKLTKENIEELEQRYHWEAIQENRRCVRLTGKIAVE